eukprot:gene3632-2567_t
MQAPVPRRSGQSLRTVTVSTLSCPAPPLCLSSFVLVAVALQLCSFAFRLPTPRLLSLSPALPTLMTACHLAVAALAAFVGLASAEKEFPLVWICLGLTAVGILIALYVAYRRPMEPYSPEGPAAEPFDEGEERQESIAAPARVRPATTAPTAAPRTPCRRPASLPRCGLRHTPGSLSSTSTCCKDLTLILYGNLVFSIHFPDGAVCCQLAPTGVDGGETWRTDGAGGVLYTWPPCHRAALDARLCSSATAVAGMQAPVPRRPGQSLRTVTVSTLSCPLPPSALPFFICSCCRCPAVVLFRLPPSYPPPTSLSLSPALPTLMTACHLAVAALAAFVGLASAEKEFPLVWICLGLTAVGILIALYVAYRRPMEPYSPEGPAAEPFDEGEERQESIAAPQPGCGQPPQRPQQPQEHRVDLYTALTVVYELLSSYLYYGDSVFEKGLEIDKKSVLYVFYIYPTYIYIYIYIYTYCLLSVFGLDPNANVDGRPLCVRCGGKAGKSLQVFSCLYLLSIIIFSCLRVSGSVFKLVFDSAVICCLSFFLCSFYNNNYYFCNLLDRYYSSSKPKKTLKETLPFLFFLFFFFSFR